MYNNYVNTEVHKGNNTNMFTEVLFINAITKTDYIMALMIFF